MLAMQIALEIFEDVVETSFKDIELEAWIGEVFSEKKPQAREDLLMELLRCLDTLARVGLAEIAPTATGEHWKEIVEGPSLSGAEEDPQEVNERFHAPRAFEQRLESLRRIEGIELSELGLDLWRPAVRPTGSGAFLKRWDWVHEEGGQVEGKCKVRGGAAFVLALPAALFPTPLSVASSWRDALSA